MCAEFFDMPDKFKLTTDGSPFLRNVSYTDSHEDQVIMVYLSDAGKHLLSTYSTWSGDGTFDTTPDLFKQVKII